MAERWRTDPAVLEVGAAATAAALVGLLEARHPGVGARGAIAAALLLAAVGGALGGIGAAFRGERARAWVLLALPVFVGLPAHVWVVRRAAELHAEVALAVGAMLTLFVGAASVVAVMLATRGRQLSLPVRGTVIVGVGLGAMLVALGPLSARAVLLSPMLAVCAAALLARLVSAARLRAPTAVALAVGGTLASGVLPGEYPGVQFAVMAPVLGAAAWAASSAARACVGRGDGGRPRPRRAAAQRVLIGSALVLSAGIGERAVAVWPEAESPRGLVGVIAEAAQRVTDFDGDGEGAWFGRRDCLPFEPRAHHDAHEVPGNGLDDDCRGGDAPPGVTARARDLEAVNAPPQPWRRRGDIVVVVIDALRFDAVSTTTPGFRRLAADAFWYERAYTPSSFTVFCMFGLLEGRLANAHPVHFGNTFAAWPTEPVDGLPSWLAHHGYATGLAGSPGDPGVYAFQEEHLGHGFRERALGRLDSTPEETTALALGVWRALGEGTPRFLLVHYLWTHVLRPPAAYPRAVEETTVALERLMSSIGDDVAWILLADHGEELGEHGGASHGRSLFAEVVHVPLVIRLPGRAGRPITSVSPTRSLAATLMALVAPESLPAGRGPYLCLDQADCHDLPVPMALEMPQTHLHGLVFGDLHVIRRLPRGVSTAYDLRTDPLEQRPLPRVPAALESALHLWEDAAIGSREATTFWPYRSPAFP